MRCILTVNTRSVQGDGRRVETSVGVSSHVQTADSYPSKLMLLDNTC